MPGSSAGSRFTLLRPDEHQHATLRTIDLLQLIDTDAARRGESRRCLGRLSVRVERVRDCGPLPLDLLIRLPFGHAMHAHCEPARRCEPFDLAVRDRGRCQALRYAVGERLGEREQRFRRQLFGAELEQEVPLGHALKLPRRRA